MQLYGTHTLSFMRVVSTFFILHDKHLSLLSLSLSFLYRAPYTWRAFFAHCVLVTYKHKHTHTHSWEDDNIQNERHCRRVAFHREIQINCNNFHEFDFQALVTRGESSYVGYVHVQVLSSHALLRPLVSSFSAHCSQTTHFLVCPFRFCDASTCTFIVAELFVTSSRRLQLMSMMSWFSKKPPTQKITSLILWIWRPCAWMALLLRRYNHIPSWLIHMDSAPWASLVNLCKNKLIIKK